MSAASTPNQQQGLWGSLGNIFGANSPASPSQALQQQALTTWNSTNITASIAHNPLTYSTASTVIYNTAASWGKPELDAETAANIITQFDEDHTLIDSKGRLKFGKYRHKRLCKADLEYIVALGRALGKLRQAINKDIRQRRALARLTQ